MNRKIFIQALRDEAQKLITAADALEELEILPLELSDEVIAVSPEFSRRC